MKTIITVTNATPKVKELIKNLCIENTTFDKVVSSRKDGVFVIEDKVINDTMKTIEVINIFISEKDINPLYDISVTENEAMQLITNVYTANEIPYCELVSDLFPRQEVQCNDCSNCIHECNKRQKELTYTPEIMAIFDAYCKEIYENNTNDFKKIQIAIARDWPVDVNIETLKKYAKTEEELFENFIHGDFNDFITMSGIVKKYCPEYLHYYFHHRKLRLKELIIHKYTDIW